MKLKELIKTLQGTVVYAGEKVVIMRVSPTTHLVLHTNPNKMEYDWEYEEMTGTIEKCISPDLLITKPRNMAELRIYCYQYCLCTMLNMYKDGKLEEAVSIFYPLDHGLEYCFGEQVKDNRLHTFAGEYICPVNSSTEKTFQNACDRAYTDFYELVDDDEEDDLTRYEEKAEREYDKRMEEIKKWL